METKGEYTTDDTLEELMRDLVSAGESIAGGYDWGSGVSHGESQRDDARAALREYVDALVSNGITAQIAENLEHIDRLEFVVDGYQEQIAEMRAKIDTLEADLASETRWAKEYHDKWQAALSDLRELQE